METLPPPPPRHHQMSNFVEGEGRAAGDGGGNGTQERCDTAV
jgi:hypothetical protein